MSNAVDALLQMLAAQAADHGLQLDGLGRRLDALEELAGEQAAALAWAAETALAAVDGEAVDVEWLAAARRTVSDWQEQWSPSPTLAPTN